MELRTAKTRTATARTATAEDAAEVADLLDRFNREFGDPTPGVPALTARLQGLLAGPEFAALLLGRPAIGLATLAYRPSVWESGPVGLLEDLWVRPDLRSRGHGAVLLRAAERAVRARGGTRLEIGVDSVDADARRFYEREGYSSVESGSTQLTYVRQSPLPSGPSAPGVPAEGRCS